MDLISWFLQRLELMIPLKECYQCLPLLHHHSLPSPSCRCFHLRPHWHLLSHSQDRRHPLHRLSRRRLPRRPHYRRRRYLHRLQTRCHLGHRCLSILPPPCQYRRVIIITRDQYLKAWKTSQYLWYLLNPKDSDEHYLWSAALSNSEPASGWGRRRHPVNQASLCYLRWIETEVIAPAIEYYYDLMLEILL